MLNLFPRDYAYDAWLADIEDRTGRVIIEEEIDYSEVFEATAEHGLITLEHLRDEDFEPGSRTIIVIPLGKAEEVAAAIVHAARRARQ